MGNKKKKPNINKLEVLEIINKYPDIGVTRLAEMLDRRPPTISAFIKRNNIKIKDNRNKKNKTLKLQIEEYLKENPGVHSRKQIKEALGVNSCAIATVLRTDPNPRILNSMEYINHICLEYLEKLKSPQKVSDIAKQLGVEPHTLRANIKKNPTLEFHPMIETHGKDTAVLLFKCLITKQYTTKRDLAKVFRRKESVVFKILKKYKLEQVYENFRIKT